MAHDQDERHVPRTGRRLRPYTARSLLTDRAVDAVLRIVEGAPVRLLILAGVVVGAADVVWRVLAVAGVCR